MKDFMIDWDSPWSQILWNPRMPEAERDRQAKLLGALPELREHFWVGTSGSSGQAKWVALSREAVLAAAEGANRHLASNAGDVWLKALPSFHVGGLGILARARLSSARVAEYEGKWSAQEFHELAEKSQATLSALVPAQIFDLVQAGFRSPKGLRAIIVGGGALAEGPYFSARELGWNLLPSYGLTECASQVATATLDSLSLSAIPDLQVLPHVEARTRQGADGQEDRIEIRSPALLTAYAIERGGALEIIDPKREGWFLTEDRGEVHEGKLIPRGREGSFIKMGGESVDFARLERLFEEARLEAHFTGEAVIIAAPDERMGALTHLVVAEGLPETGELENSFNRKVLPVERIRKVHRIAQFPRSPLGKLLKRELLRVLGFYF